MGYRKAAMRRQTQWVRSHTRTSKTGKTYVVRGHIRNDHGPSDLGGCLAVFGGLFLACVIGLLGIVQPWLFVMVAVAGLALFLRVGDQAERFASRVNSRFEISEKINQAMARGDRKEAKRLSQEMQQRHRL